MNGKLINVVGDVTNPQYTGENEIAIIPHCCNDVRVMGAGVALALKRKWAGVEYYYLKGRMVLGDISYVNPNTELNNIMVVNMIGQHGCVSTDNTKPVKYWALAKAMLSIVKEVIPSIKEKTPDVTPVIHCPKFGSDLAGGNWDFILELIKEIWIENGIDVVVYEFG